MGEQARSDGDDVQALAREFHDNGFVTLEALGLTPPPALVERARAAVLRKYDAHLALARAQSIDLSLLKNAEVLAGFYVREGGRVDMQISALEFQPPRSTAIADSGGAEDAVSAVDPNDTAIDTAPFYEMARCWERLIATIFSAESGDLDQNWHLDGVHRNLLKHERADRLNVFVPLVDLSDDVGGTEMKRASHVRASENGAAFESYAHLPSVTPAVRAGTPIAMDYRVWHRGRANASDVLRPLLYFKYVQVRETPVPSKRASATARETNSSNSADAPTKKRKRIVLTHVAPPASATAPSQQQPSS